MTAASRRFSAYDPSDFDSPFPNPFSFYESADFSDLPRIVASELIDTSIISVDGDSSVEDACKVLLESNAACLAVKRTDADAPGPQYVGLFDYADVNAFLVLALNSSNLRPFELDDPRIAGILTAAKQGYVPIRLAINMSEKNPLVALPADADLMALLSVFSRGTHRVAIQDGSGDLLGFVSDTRLVEWFMDNASTHPGLASVLISPLANLPGIYMHPVISSSTDDTLLDAMRLLSEQGVSSVAVVDSQGMLLSALSVKDVGKRVVPSKSKRILDVTLGTFISIIKADIGSDDGADLYPVFSILPSSTLTYTMQKLLATNSHRVFLTDDPSCPPSPPVSFAGLNLTPSGTPIMTNKSLPGSFPSPITPGGGPGNLRGVVSVLDVLSVFARLLGVPDVDPTQASRHRRASSCSTRSGGSLRTRSSISSFSPSMASSVTSGTSFSSRSRSLGARASEKALTPAQMADAAAGAVGAG